MLIYHSTYDCKADDMEHYLTIADGANNLASIEWGTRIHSLRCRNFDPGDRSSKVGS